MAKRWKKNYKLRESDLRELSERLYDYSLMLNVKLHEFLDKCLDEGIRTARRTISGSKYKSLITFEKEFKTSSGNCVAVMVGVGEEQIEVWQTASFGTRSAVVNPLLMEEFGSGQYAENPLGIDGVGRGTFPGQTHAFEDEWYWYDTEGALHSSSGYEPSAPMYQASCALYMTVDKIAKEVFTK